MAVAGVVRGRHRDRRRRERHRAALRGHRSRAVVRRTPCGSRGRSRCGGRLAAVGRIGALTVGVSLWWIAGLWAQGKYGIPILRYTETYETVAKVSNAPELLRGPRVLVLLRRRQARPVDRAERRLHPAPVAHRCRVPARDRWPPRRRSLAVEAPRLLRRAPRDRHDHRGRLAPVRRPDALRVDLLPIRASRPRARAALDATRGAADRPLARGAARCRDACARQVAPDRWASWPRSPRSPSRSSTCLRSSPARCWPTTCSGPRTSRRTGSKTRTTCSQQGDATRVLELPGADFASYRWGNTVDPVLPGLMDRPYVARELIPYGSAPSADLLNALDRRLQEGWYEPSSLAPVAALMGVGEINVRSDLQYERYRTPRPRNLWADIEATPGLGAPTDVRRRGAQPRDPRAAADRRGRTRHSPDAADPPPVAAFPVERTRDIVRAENADGVMLMAGSGEGIVDAAAAGIIADGPTGALLGVVRERPRGHAARARRRRPPRADRHEPTAGASMGNGSRERRRHRASRREGARRRSHRQPARGLPRCGRRHHDDRRAARGRTGRRDRRTATP